MSDKVLLGVYALWNRALRRYAEGDRFTTRHEAECACGFNFDQWEVREVLSPDGAGAGGGA